MVATAVGVGVAVDADAAAEMQVREVLAAGMPVAATVH